MLKTSSLENKLYCYGLRIYKMNYLSSISKLLNKIATFTKNELSNIKKLPSTVKIHTSSQFVANRLNYKRGCHLTIDEQSQVDGAVSFDKENASIFIGKRVFMNGNLIAAQSIHIDDDVLISWGVTIVDHNSHSISFSHRLQDVIDWRLEKKDWTHVKIAPVKICSKTWIGFNAIILKGVTIGEGSVVGAGSVVTKDVLPWTVVAGNPARIIREIPENER